MKNEELVEWQNVDERYINDETDPRLIFNTDDVGYSLFCTITPDGVLTINSSGGGGHGDPGWVDNSKPLGKWLSMIKEIDKVAEKLFAKEGF